MSSGTGSSTGSAASGGTTSTSTSSISTGMLSSAGDKYTPGCGGPDGLMVFGHVFDAVDGGKAGPNDFTTADSNAMQMKMLPMFRDHAMDYGAGVVVDSHRTNGGKRTAIVGMLRGEDIVSRRTIDDIRSGRLPDLSLTHMFSTKINKDGTETEERIPIEVSPTKKGNRPGCGIIATVPVYSQNFATLRDYYLTLKRLMGEPQGQGQAAPLATAAQTLPPPAAAPPAGAAAGADAAATGQVPPDGAAAANTSKFDEYKKMTPEQIFAHSESEGVSATDWVKMFMTASKALQDERENNHVLMADREKYRATLQEQYEAKAKSYHERMAKNGLTPATGAEDLIKDLWASGHGGATAVFANSETMMNKIEEQAAAIERYKADAVQKTTTDGVATVRDFLAASVDPQHMGPRKRARPDGPSASDPLSRFQFQAWDRASTAGIPVQPPVQPQQQPPVQQQQPQQPPQQPAQQHPGAAMFQQLANSISETTQFPAT